MSTDVGTRHENGVAYLTLNRPDAMNAITTELARELERALADAAGEARTIVIRGAGGNFCAGGDYKHLESLRERGRDAMADLFEAFGQACESIARLPVPVIAAVEGNALAGGFELMQSCDLALVRDDARIGDHHIRFAMVPGGGSTQRLPRLVGRQRALALILSGDSLSGTEAVEWGLAYRAASADAFDELVTKTAERLAEKDPKAVAAIKALVADGLERPLAEGLEREREAVVEHLLGEGAMAAFSGGTGG